MRSGQGNIPGCFVENLARSSQGGCNDPFLELIKEELSSAAGSLQSSHEAAMQALAVSHTGVGALIEKHQERLSHAESESQSLRAENQTLREMLAARGLYKDACDGDAAAGGGGGSGPAAPLPMPNFSGTSPRTSAAIVPISAPVVPGAFSAVVPMPNEANCQPPPLSTPPRMPAASAHGMEMMPGMIRDKAAGTSYASEDSLLRSTENTDAQSSPEDGPICTAMRKNTTRMSAMQRAMEVEVEVEEANHLPAVSSASCASYDSSHVFDDVDDPQATTKTSAASSSSKPGVRFILDASNPQEFVAAGSSENEQKTTRNSGKLQFDLLNVWIAASDVVVASRDHSAKTMRNKMLIAHATKGVPGSNDEEPQKLCQMLHPGSPVRGLWDFCSLILVLYDLINIPLMFLDPPENDFTKKMAWTTRLYWSLDIPLSFVTGTMMANGTVVMNHWIVAKRYISTWFFLDLGLVAIDWIQVFLEEASGAQNAARVGRASRTFRILRMVRLLRLVRVRTILAAIRQRIRSEWLRILVDIGKIMAAILAVAHFIACIWCGIGAQETKSWLTEFGYNGSYERNSLEHRYLMALHWSISQFHGGMDEITPQNFNERLFAVMIFLVAWMMAAAFVSGLTSQMTRLHILASHQSRQLNILQRYLKQCKISDRLAVRVTRNAQHAICEQQRLMPEAEVELLKHVSVPLRIELHFEMYSPVLEVHPFMIQYIAECPQVMRKVCHQAMSTYAISKGDVIFNAGEIPAHPKMYVVCSGTLEYIPLTGPTREANVEMCIAEAVLWTKWMHRGVMKATTDGRLCWMDARIFQDIVGHFDHREFDPRRYAGFFVRHLNKLLDNGDNDTITDMPMAQDEIARETFNKDSVRSSVGIMKMFDRRKSAFMDPRGGSAAVIAGQSIVKVAGNLTRRMSLHGNVRPPQSMDSVSGPGFHTESARSSVDEGDDSDE